ncbi:hypothetical protein CesoFtcFv8_006326 [Champsocephalus esox]|uniref:Uncharacterized protein n=2 Tax=Champsocephalus TaxID=52236 RepID=A0AAN8HVQ2_CHAGU|nr:hypothetical protein CesoFtcFv8_006326 [Champsocephalus esox]KAK5929452.1 hypothetical protein CgunFtcFv8_010681 [Champsocephalus gunnari]
MADKDPIENEAARYREKREEEETSRGRGAMVIPAGRGPIPMRVAMLSKAHTDPKGTPRTHPEEKGR